MTKPTLCLQILLSVVAYSLMTPVALAQEEADCVRGNPDAPIRIEVFSDYQCPACRAFYLQTFSVHRKCRARKRRGDEIFGHFR